MRSTTFIVAVLKIMRATNTSGAAFFRFIVGTSLAALGVRFVMDMQALTEVVPGQTFPLGAFLLAHVIVITHIGGGLLMAAGFLTRWAAAAQVPILLGALSLVGTTSASLAVPPEFALPFVIMASLVFLLGGGRYSVDRWLAEQPSSESLPLRLAAVPVRRR